ncbi:MAG: hypothetical protein DWQ42_07035 [Planctomycetota bacterium]|nr:MAG: hypothetical protein DWQ42_07035 [Planctomycetota bacterium]REK38447.1 MAG: hypothetical protein DWQ46_20150 [Planctomycetota bacterium]
MNLVNRICTSLTDALLGVFSGWSPALLLIAISAVLGILMAIVFRFTSQQAQLKRVADLSRAQVLAIKLFKDELGTMFVSLGRLFRYTGLRLWYSLPPALVMVIPFVLVLVQLARWYEHSPLVDGDVAMLEFHLNEADWSRHKQLQLEAAAPLELTHRHNDAVEKVVTWNVHAHGEDAASIDWRLGDLTGTKRIAIGASRDALAPVDAQIAGPSFWDRLLYPGEPAFASDAPIREVTLQVHERDTPILGLNVPWWLTFLVVSILVAMLVRPLVGVQF